MDKKKTLPRAKQNIHVQSAVHMKEENEASMPKTKQIYVKTVLIFLLEHKALSDVKL